jgi:CO/xanthine dehydrogenase Mo-binding subunit
MADTAGSNGERKDFNVVGRRNIPGKLSHSIATGIAKFSTDIVVPDMLQAKLLRSPYARARVKSFDAGEARALPGVADVIAWDDPELNAPGGQGSGGGLQEAASSGCSRQFEDEA